MTHSLLQLGMQTWQFLYFLFNKYIKFKNLKFWSFDLYGRFETWRFETWRFVNLTFCKPYVETGRFETWRFETWRFVGVPLAVTTTTKIILYPNWRLTMDFFSSKCYFLYVWSKILAKNRQHFLKIGLHFLLTKQRIFFDSMLIFLCKF